MPVFGKPVKNPCGCPERHEVKLGRITIITITIAIITITTSITIIYPVTAVVADNPNQCALAFALILHQQIRETEKGGLSFDDVKGITTRRILESSA